MNTQLRIIALDLDGVIYDGASSVYPIAKAVGIEKEFLAALERTRVLPLNEAISEGCKIWRGVPVEGAFERIIEELPLREGAEETITILRNWDYEVGCISSGVSQFYLRPLKRRLGLDFAHSNILGEKDGVHDGTIQYIMDGPNKAETAMRIISDREFTTENFASIGDGENDIPMFGVSGFSIAFNPTSEDVSNSATVTVKSDDLRAILPYFQKDA